MARFRCCRRRPLEHGSYQVGAFQLVDRYAAARLLGMAIGTEAGARSGRIHTHLALRRGPWQHIIADHFQRSPDPSRHGFQLRLRRRPQRRRRRRTVFRTFRQVVHGRIYRTIDDVRAAARKFFELYDAQWLIENNGLRSPRQRISPGSNSKSGRGSSIHFVFMRS